MPSQEEILNEIENMQEGTRTKLEAKLQENNAKLCDLIQVNENINIGSPLFVKGPLYWNGIFVEENGNTKMYRISDYLNK